MAYILHVRVELSVPDMPPVGEWPGGAKLELPEGASQIDSPLERLENHYSSRGAPGPYFAMCLVVKDQGDDLREWVDYHRSIGAEKFYIFDDNSSVPALLEVQDLIHAGESTDLNFLHLSYVHVRSTQWILHPQCQHVALAFCMRSLNTGFHT